MTSKNVLWGTLISHIKEVINALQGISWHYNSEYQERLDGDDDNIDDIVNNRKSLGKPRENVSVPMWAPLTVFAGIPALKQYQAVAGTVGLLTGAQLMGSSLNQQRFSHNRWLHLTQHCIKHLFIRQTEFTLGKI